MDHVYARTVKMPSCSAVNCSNRTERDFRLCTFPKNVLRRRQWVQNMQRGNWSPTSESRLCEIHFEDSQFEKNRQDGWRKLKPNAVPTLFDAPNRPPMVHSSSRKSIPKVLPRSEPVDTQGQLILEGKAVPTLSGENVPAAASAVVPVFAQLQASLRARMKKTKNFLKKTVAPSRFVFTKKSEENFQNTLARFNRASNVTGEFSLLIPEHQRDILKSQKMRKIQCTEESTPPATIECTVIDEASVDVGDDVKTLALALEKVKKQLCRICGLRSEQLYSIFCEGETEEDIITLEKKIKMYLPIELNADDGLPLNICLKCYDLVESWHELNVACLAADSVLRERFGVSKDHAAFEGEVDQSEKKSSQEQGKEQTSGVDEQVLVDLPAESGEQVDANLGENATITIGNSCLSSNQDIRETLETRVHQIVTSCDFMKIRSPFRSRDPYTCRFCSQGFQSIQDCSLHREQCALEPAICDVCGIIVRRRRNLKVHRRQHFFVPVLCEKCGHQLHSKTAVFYHKHKCTGTINKKKKTKFFCEPCCKVFCVERFFKAHQELHKKMKNSNLKTFSLEACSAKDREEGFICPVCGDHFQDKLSLIKHMNTDMSSSCLQCGKTLQNERAVFLHKCMKWTCCFCCAEFSEAKALYQHKRSHKSDEFFTCKQCGSKFASQLLFYQHKSLHNSSRSYQCDVCGKRFTRKYIYQDHMGRHEGIKYKCSHCDWTCFSRSAMNEHMKKCHLDVKMLSM